MYPHYPDQLSFESSVVMNISRKSLFALIISLSDVFMDGLEAALQNAGLVSGLGGFELD